MSTTALRIVTPANDLPVTLAEAKIHLRVTHNAEDGHIQSLIGAATDWAQTYMRRILVATTVGHTLTCFPSDALQLPGGIVTAVNDIKYRDPDGIVQTLTGPTSQTPGTDYQEALDDDEIAFVFPAIDGSWPASQRGARNAVVVEYQVGWPTINDVPESIREAIRFKIADFFTIRDTIDAGSKSQLLSVAENLLDPYVVPDF